MTERPTSAVMIREVCKPAEKRDLKLDLERAQDLISCASDAARHINVMELAASLPPCARLPAGSVTPWISSASRSRTMTTSVVPRIPRRRRRSRKPLLVELIWLRIWLRATLWRHHLGRKAEIAIAGIRCCWVYCKWQFWRTLRRMLDAVLPRRR